MKKSIMNIGRTLSKVEQKQVTGGDHPDFCNDNSPCPGGYVCVGNFACVRA
ncbi:hypothetical protein ACFSTE_07255 [Aquimarina hainanensis]|uniref:Bacteriocin-type signal sequence-containing protein n=1 Tax=Aquimarina hainanensis TaxID=1578017 RepID=A0ABW5N513_9FLAO